MTLARLCNSEVNKKHFHANNIDKFVFTSSSGVFAGLMSPSPFEKS